MFPASGNGCLARVVSRGSHYQDRLGAAIAVDLYGWSERALDFSDLIKGALLHDVGKFIQRAGNEQRKTHQEIGAAWLKSRGVPETVAVFATRHHRLSQQDPGVRCWTLLPCP